jgi:hypothetical protein
MGATADLIAEEVLHKGGLKLRFRRCGVVAADSPNGTACRRLPWGLHSTVKFL